MKPSEFVLDVDAKAKVYVVLLCEYDETTLIGVFSSEQKAIEVISLVRPVENQSAYSIVSTELDTFAPGIRVHIN